MTNEVKMGERKKTGPETFRGPHHGPEAATTAERFANIKAVHVTWADVDEGWCNQYMDSKYLVRIPKQNAGTHFNWNKQSYMG